MDMWERTFYLRASTYTDLVDDATHLFLLETLHDLRGGPFDRFRDIHRRARPRPVDAALILEELHGMVGQGLNQVVRFRLESDEGAVRALEYNAGSHPYSGAFVSQIDVRFDRSWARDDLDTLRGFAKLVSDRTCAFQLHVHDTDDNAIQNIGMPGLLRSGYGLDVESVDLASNPGRELSRGELRYCVNWLTVFGPELIERLGSERISSAPMATLTELDVDWRSKALVRGRLSSRFEDEETKEEEPRWLMLELEGDPLEPESMREAQRAVRDHLDLSALAQKERYNLGYWQRKA